MAGWLFINCNNQHLSSCCFCCHGNPNNAFSLQIFKSTFSRCLKVLAVKYWSIRAANFSVFSNLSACRQAPAVRSAGALENALQDYLNNPKSMFCVEDSVKEQGSKIFIMKILTIKYICLFKISVSVKICQRIWSSLQEKSKYLKSVSFNQSAWQLL